MDQTYYHNNFTTTFSSSSLLFSTDFLLLTHVIRTSSNLIHGHDALQPSHHIWSHFPFDRMCYLRILWFHQHTFSSWLCFCSRIFHLWTPVIKNREKKPPHRFNFYKFKRFGENWTYFLFEFFSFHILNLLSILPLTRSITHSLPQNLMKLVLSCVEVIISKNHKYTLTDLCSFVCLYA